MDAINNSPYDFRLDKPSCECGDTVCKKTVVQKADVNIPVDIKPTAEVGIIKAECIGEPQITNDMCKESCKIIITQTISVKIPIQYNVATKVGESEVICYTAKGI